MIWGILCGTIGTILCNAEKNGLFLFDSFSGGLIPLNKNLWSLSFILCMAGLAFILLTICYYLIDRLNVWAGWPFIYVGMNSIAIYTIHEIFSEFFPASFKNDGTHEMILISNIIGVSFWLTIAYLMH